MAATERILPAVAMVVLAAMATDAGAAVLPEDRTDVMYHGYDGDGLQVSGPSILVRKGLKEQVSVWGNYYVDSITSASIDVVATASEYTEKRTETSLGVDYLHGKTFMGLSWTRSEESDYTANALRFGISQDFFGDLTTLGISYGYGADEVRRSGDDVFAEDTQRQAFRVDVSQVVTKNMVLSLNYETITDEGFLNNPYRQVRYVDESEARGFAYQLEVYPRTKTSTATALRAMYYLPYRASLKGEYRHYTDSWGVIADNAELAYLHPIGDRFTVEGRYRYYTQTAADFYSDLFPRIDSQNFLARDKELATFDTHTLGIGVSYAFDLKRIPLLSRGEANLFVDYIRFQYDDFRDATAVGFATGEEPLFDFGSVVVRLFFSFWY